MTYMQTIVQPSPKPVAPRVIANTILEYDPSSVVIMGSDSKHVLGLGFDPKKRQVVLFTEMEGGKACH